MSLLWLTRHRFAQPLPPCNALRAKTTIRMRSKPAAYLGPRPWKIVQTRPLIAILYEDFNHFRQIYLDGRSLPKDPDPTWLGYSVGRWEADTLVIESAGFNGKIDLPGGAPSTQALRITERYRRRDFGHLERTITISDPSHYTKPWTYSIDAILVPDDDVLENICVVGEKDQSHMVGK